MMTAWLIAGIFLFLSLIHFYWACGGQWGATVVLPKRAGKPLFQPGVMITLAVAGVLLFAAYLPLGLMAALPPLFSFQVCFYLNLGLALVFLARSIGEFRYVGFFKRVTDSDFAQWDSRLFSPLCLLICLLLFRLLLTNLNGLN